MSIEIEIKGHGGGIRITVLGYENPAANEPSDANWLVCRVNLGVGPFRGEMVATFATQDFAAFASELSALLQGETQRASFQTDEQALDLQVEMAPRGAARISGTARYSSGPDVRISFTLESDQTFLVPVVRALETVLQDFPVRR
jgi:hypothetical protein